MNCQDVAKFVQVYLDGEFDQRDRTDFEGHLKGCPGCQRQVDYERRFKEAVRARIPRETAPAELRERLASSLQAVPRRPLVPKLLMWSSIPAAAALVLVVTFTWTVTSGFTPLVEEAVDRHSSQPPVDLRSADDAEVEGWFKSKVNFNVALPRFSGGALHLVGARLSQLGERQAALVRYQQGTRSYSLFVFTDPGGPMTDSDGPFKVQRCQKVAKKKLCLAEKRGYTVVVWRSHGLAYSLVGDLPAPQMLEVLSASFSP